LAKKTNDKIIQPDDLDRETKIMNLIMNTTILLMSTFVEAFSDAFTQMAKKMTTSVTDAIGASEEKSNEISEKFDQMKTEVPTQMIEMILSMKTDVDKQLSEKRDEIRKIIADPKFDEGITIAEKYDFGIPKMTQDIDELTLIRYIALLKANDQRCSQMLQDLLKWMKNVPQPE
jgi:hypothetical protein